MKWFRNKNNKKIKSKPFKKSTEDKNNDKTVTIKKFTTNIKDVTYLTKIFNCFCEEFWKIGRELVSNNIIDVQNKNIFEQEKAPIIEYKEIDGTPAYYTNNDHKISMNLININKTVSCFKKFIELDNPIIKDYDELQKLIGINNTPCSTLIHELCHAWLFNDHKSGMHDSINLTVEKKTSNYTFDDSANLIWNKILIKNFLSIWLEKIKKIIY